MSILNSVMNVFKLTGEDDYDEYDDYDEEFEDDEDDKGSGDSTLPARRAHSASQAAAKGDSSAAGDGALRLENPEVFRRAGHQMLAHHLAALKQPECGNLIAEFKFRTALFRKCSLLIREVAAVLIAEEQCYGVFVDGLTMTGVPLADDVLSLVRHSHSTQVGVSNKN